MLAGTLKWNLIGWNIERESDVIQMQADKYDNIYGGNAMYNIMWVFNYVVLKTSYTGSELKRVMSQHT